MTYDDNYYRNCLLCAVKIAMSLGATSIFEGCSLFVDSSIPTSQKLGTSVAMITGIVLALITDVSDMQNDTVWLPLQPSLLAKRIASKFIQIKPTGSVQFSDLELQLSAIFIGKPSSMYFRKTQIDDSDMHEFGQIAVREFPSNPNLLYMETVPGASKMKENIAKLKTVLEFRLFLRSIGCKDVQKSKTITEIISSVGMTLEELRIALKDKFDNKNYPKSTVEETMGLEMIELVSDIPFASQTLEAIFTVNPFQ